MRTNERLAEGHRLNGRYRVCRSLGQGGFGITYLAADELLGQNIVIKEYFPAVLAGRATDGSVRIEQEEGREAFEEGRSRFLREARILTSLLDVPGVVKAWNYFQENQTAYLVMEYVQGISLRSWLEQHGEVSFEEALRMLKPVVLALAGIHKKGLLHRDITPDNLMVGENGTVKLLDFGSARSYLREKDSEMTQTVLLKSGYAPPEQYDGKSVQGPWTDLYALCATMYEMITGCMPEDAIQRQIRDELEAPSAYGAKITPEQEEHLLKRGLALDERERYASVAEFSADFYPEEKVREVRYGRSRRRMAATGGGVLAAGLLLVLGLYEFGALGGAHTEKRAGNLDRGSKAYEAFLEFVKTHGESTKEENTYILNESDVRQIGLPGNLYYDIDSTEETVIAILQEADPSWEPQPDDSEERFTVTTGDYGIIQTDFTVEDGYRLPDGIRIFLDYDYNNEKLHEIRILPGQELNCEKAALLTQTLLDGLCHDDPETDLGGMADAMREIQEKTESGALVYTAWYRGDLVAQLYEAPSEMSFRAGIRIRRNTENAAAYHW